MRTHHGLVFWACKGLITKIDYCAAISTMDPKEFYIKCLIAHLSFILTISYQTCIYANVAMLYSLAVAPLFLTPPENLTVVQPEDATFFCEATARPGPTITWWRVEEGVPVQLFDGIDYTIVEGATGERIRNSTLTVNGTEPSDALDYFCRARNMAGVVEATAELIVHGE